MSFYQSLSVFRPEIFEMLKTPLSWAIAEILSIGLFLFCIYDVLKRNDGKNQFFRLMELFGFVLYSGLYENIGVLLSIYDYSFDRLIMVGVVPLSILLFEAVIFYAALLFAEQLNLPKWAIPIIVGFLCMLQDLTIDPVAVFDLQYINGVGFQGRWNWTPRYEFPFFGIPYFNYSGWFMMMFYYATFILIGRYIFEKHEKKPSFGFLYTILAPLFSFLLIISPINQMMLFSPLCFIPTVGLFNRTAEIIMLLIITGISIITVFKFRKKEKTISYKDYKPIWIIPTILHVFDIILAFSLGIVIAYIPVILFGTIHLSYIGYFLIDNSKLKLSKKEKHS